MQIVIYAFYVNGQRLHKCCMEYVHRIIRFTTVSKRNATNTFFFLSQNFDLIPNLNVVVDPLRTKLPFPAVSRRQVCWPSLLQALITKKKRVYTPVSLLLSSFLWKRNMWHDLGASTLNRRWNGGLLCVTQTSCCVIVFALLGTPPILCERRPLMG